MHASDSKRSPGRLSRQGPEVLRWLLFEAAKTSARGCAPGHACFSTHWSKHWVVDTGGPVKGL